VDLINVQAMSKRFGGIVALEAANFAARAGEVHALLANGWRQISQLVVWLWLFTLVWAFQYRLDARLVADPESHLPQTRFNDGKTDRQGRFWSGSMFDMPGQPPQFIGSLYRLDSNLIPHRVIEGGPIQPFVGQKI